MTQPPKPADTETPNDANNANRSGNAQRPSDTLDKDQDNQETVPRKSSLLPD